MNDEDTEKIQRLEKAEYQRSKTNAEDSEDSFYWKNSGQHIIYFIIYVLDWSSLGVLHYEDGVKEIKYDPTVVHYFVVFVACGAPLMFLHTFVGQYSQTGYFAFGTMLPLAYGTGFLMVIFSTVKLAIHFYYACFLLYYLFVSLYNITPPWVVCYNAIEYPIQCFSWKDIDLCVTMERDNQPCFEPGTKVLAAIYFMRMLGIDGGEATTKLSFDPMDTFTAVIYGLFHGFLVFVCLIMLSTRSFKNLEATIRISFYLCVVGILSLTMTGITHTGAAHGLQGIVLSITFDSLFSIDTWSATFRRVIEAMKFAEGGAVMFGTFIPPSDVSPYRSSVLSTAFALFAFFFTVYVKIFEGLLTSKLHLKISQLMMGSEECLIFALYPIILGMQAYGNFFCFVYFLLVIIMNFCSMMLKVIVIEKGLAYQFNLTSYYSYTRFFIALGSFVIAVSILIPMSGDTYYNLLGRLKKFMIGLVFLQMAIVHLYGLQRFCDDIQFYHRTTVSTFMKMCWIMMPLFCIIEFNLENVQTAADSQDTVITVILVSSFCVPLLMGLLYISVILAKDRNLIGLLRPMDKYGPRDIQQRIYRLLYNPRLSEKYIMTSLRCDHNCLMHSEALEVAIDEEKKLIRKLIVELEKSKGEASQVEGERRRGRRKGGGWKKPPPGELGLPQNDLHGESYTP